MMGHWRLGILNVMVVAMSTMPQVNCDILSDPASRLEECLSRAVNVPANPGAVFRVSCDLRITGRYTVVIHPAGYVSDDDLVWAGLARELVPEIRSLRLRNDPGMYVIASGPDVTGIGASRTVASSRTSSQSSFVQIDQLMVVTRNTQPLRVDVGRPYGGNVIQRVY